MLSIHTTDDWSFALTVTSPGSSANTETFNYIGEPSAYVAMVAFRLWANDAARPWASTFDWSWSKHTDGGAKVTIICSNTFDILVDATAYRRLGIQSASGVTSHTGINSMAGTWAPGKYGRLQVSRVFQFSNDPGDGNPAGAVRSFVPGLADSSPAITATGTPTDSARLGHEMARAKNPRKAHVYQVHTNRFIPISMGAGTRESLDFINYQFSIEARGL